MKFTSLAAFAAITLGAAAPTLSATIYDNPDVQYAGNCAFNTNCGGQFTGNTFAAQRFTLATPTTLTGASFTAWLGGNASPSSVNWLILSANVNLPGSILASGNASFSSTEFIASNGYTITKFNYNLPSIALGGGDYYLGFQAVSSFFEVYLGQLPSGTGAAQSNDGGVNWGSGYQGLPGIASSLSGDTGVVPEPASWAMMIAGFGLVGAAMRRRKAALAA